MRFEEAVQYLLSLGHETLTIKLGLRNTELLLHSVNNPEKTFPSVQIAGTNGKGSTAVVLDTICRVARIRTGLYTSPHLSSITERITVAGVEITPQEFARHTSLVRDAAQHLLSTSQIEALPTFFEQLTVVALSSFRDAGVELTILETGLGGRLDSTTAAQAEVVGLTPIALDHEEYLGNTIESIASEKAAIIRQGVSAVIASQSPEALEVILKRCAEVNVAPRVGACKTTIEDSTPDGRFCVTFETAEDTYPDVWLGLRGRHQIDNVALAIQLAEALRHNGFKIDHSAIVDGVQRASHPGRLELIRPFLLDGAHNPAGAKSLRDYLDEFGADPLTVVFGAMRDKRLNQIAELLFPLADKLILTEVNNPRTASLETLSALAERFTQAETIQTKSSTEALSVALQASPDHLICVTGSLYLIGEIRPLILNAQSETARGTR
jgi:dihydrofolate synthase/folylpolyglutamate synthase